MQNNRYTILFSLVLCLVLSVLLSGVYMALKEKQEANKRIDMQKNVLEAALVPVNSNDEVEALFAKRVRELVVSRQGKIVAAADFEAAFEGKSDLLALYRILKPDGKTTSSYVYPIEGKGLWSTLLGFLAVEPNGKTVVGITFYKQGETPGLGAEIVQPWFRKQFAGKELYENGEVVGISVAKGKAADPPKYKTQKTHMVDGISGATITGDGVAKMLDVDPEKYAPFFAQQAG